MGDWADESPSDEDDVNEIENELYSMFYYHSMSDGIPEDLSKKYNVDVDDFGVTISLKDASNNVPPSGNTARSDQLGGGEETENITISNDRYIDGRKGDKYFVLDRQTVSYDRTVSVNEISEEKLPEKLPVHSPNPQITPRNSRFQSSRYFFQGNPITYNYKNNFKYRHDNYNSTHMFKNQSHVNGFSKESFHHRALLSSTPIVKRKSDYLNGTPLKKQKNKPEELIITEDIEDVVDLTEESKKPKKKKKKKNSLNKSENPVITISSESENDSDSDLIITDSESEFDSESDFDSEYSGKKESFDSILLNTSMPEDRNYCDISVINIDYDWKLTSSPEGWTQSMKKFYNKPSKKHLNFDYRDILQEIRSQGSGDWSICKADKHRFKGSRRVRCLRCQQEGHVKSQCTKVISCHMCGTPGHSSKKCPQKICLKCGSKCRDLFPSGCGVCVNGEKTACSVCGNQGHNSTICTDAWRSQFLNDESKNSKERTGTKYCCNCGKSGHYYEDCWKTNESPSNSRGGEWKDWKTFKASFKKNRSPKKKKNFMNDSHTSLPSNHKRDKFRLRSKMLKNSRNEKHMALDLHFPNRRMKNGHISKRILMMRKSNKKNMYKAYL